MESGDAMSEFGTLKELGVRVGDVVADGSGKDYSIQMIDNKTDHPRARLCDIGKLYALSHCGKSHQDVDGSFIPHWRIITRATPTPKLWSDLTPAEKGALLLAHHDGGQLQYMYNSDWVDCNDVFSGHYAYRIKPHIPKTATETFYGHSTKSVNCEWGFSRVTNGFSDTHRITFQTIDGKPDCASVKLEEV